MSLSPRLLSRASISCSSRSLARLAACIPGPSRIPYQAQAQVRPNLQSRSAIPFRRNATTVAPGSSSTSAPNLPPIPADPTIRVTPPNLTDIKEEGFFDDDVALLPEQEARLVITPQAVQQLALITSREPPDTIAKGKLALRVGVESGGCHGYQYTMALTEERGVDDYVMTPEGVESIPVVIDLMSLGLMKGATLHHATELIGSSFRIQGNPQAKDGGACGCGISWEAK